MTFINTQPINATDEKGRVAPRATTRAKHPFIRTGRRLWNIQHSFLLFFLVVLIAKTPVTSFLPSFPRRPRSHKINRRSLRKEARKNDMIASPGSQDAEGSGGRRGRRRWDQGQTAKAGVFFFSSFFNFFFSVRSLLKGLGRKKRIPDYPDT